MLRSVNGGDIVPRPGDEDQVNAIVLAWFNTFSASKIDEFFWDYPGPRGSITAGYGIGRMTATEIVRRRNEMNGFHSVDELLAVPGFGEDKLSDAIRQAREALYLARWTSAEEDPGAIQETLFQYGPGTPLAPLITAMTRRSPVLGAENIEVLAPFVVLATHRHAGSDDDPNAYLRVRLEPWAFVAHAPENVRFLRLRWLGGEDWEGRILPEVSVTQPTGQRPPKKSWPRRIHIT
jgi:hypothetical protein